LRSWIHFPRRTGRLRLTALYGVLFLLSGAGLLAITYAVVTGRPINASFGVEQSGVVLKAAPLQAKRLVAYSECMRAHGVPNYPVPTVTDGGRTVELEGAFDAQRRFVANASHELRTPLAMMRTSLDVALGKPDPPGEVKVLAAKLEEGLDQAEKLLDNLLVLARSQRGAFGPPTPVSLPALAQVSFQANNAEVTRLGLAVEEATAPADVMGNGILLARMVVSVVDNAVHHNVAGGVVRISSGSDGRWARLVVENDGPVVGAERVAQLGEPFFRPGAERIVGGKGLGLGLSIAKAVAAAHGGAVVFACPARGWPPGRYRTACHCYGWTPSPGRGGKWPVFRRALWQGRLGDAPSGQCRGGAT
jgi:signal transduction histidine kinase